MKAKSTSNRKATKPGSTARRAKRNASNDHDDTLLAQAGEKIRHVAEQATAAIAAIVKNVGARRARRQATVMRVVAKGTSAAARSTKRLSDKAERRADRRTVAAKRAAKG